MRTSRVLAGAPANPRFVGLSYDGGNLGATTVRVWPGGTLTDTRLAGSGCLSSRGMLSADCQPSWKSERAASAEFEIRTRIFGCDWLAVRSKQLYLNVVANIGFAPRDLDLDG